MFNVYNWYRLGNILHRYHIPILPKLVTYSIRLIFGCYIPHTCQIGKGTKFGYGGIGVVLHDRSVIGENCIISQGVTLGGTSNKFEVPRIGSNVYVGAGAKIIGPVIIGNNVVVGANAVILKDIPDNSTVVGVPGKLIK